MYSMLRGRDVVAKDQIRTIIKTFKDKLFAEIYPGRDWVPKTLIFAKDDAHAKDFAQRKYQGAYGALRILPVVPLYQEAVATGDAIGYDRDLELTEAEKADYKVLYPAYGTYVVGEGLRWISTPWPYAILIAGVLPGHIVGRIKAAEVDDRTAPAPAATRDTGSPTPADPLARDPVVQRREGDLLPAALR